MTHAEALKQIRQAAHAGWDLLHRPGKATMDLPTLLRQIDEAVAVLAQPKVGSEHGHANSPGTSSDGVRGTGEAGTAPGTL